MKMDSGYESETGQVCLFNVTPFTPHLPHWQHEFARVCVRAAVRSCAFCVHIGTAGGTRMHILCFFTVNTKG